MTTVETIGRIRRAYFVEKVSVREIARRLHVSRKTVRRAIDAEDGQILRNPQASALGPGRNDLCVSIPKELDRAPGVTIRGQINYRMPHGLWTIWQELPWLGCRHCRTDRGTDAARSRL